MRFQEMNTLRQLEQYQQRVSQLEEELERMNEMIRELRLNLEKERDRVSELTIHSRQQQERIESLASSVGEKDLLVAEFTNKLHLQVGENASLQDEIKRLLADNQNLRQRVEELEPIKALHLDR